jgi:hypothetical protein
MSIAKSTALVVCELTDVSMLLAGFGEHATVTLSADDKRLAVILNPLEAKHVADWLLAFAGEHITNCWYCKKPLLITEAKRVGQDWAHAECCR